MTSYEALIVVPSTVRQADFEPVAAADVKELRAAGMVVARGEMPEWSSLRSRLQDAVEEVRDRRRALAERGSRESDAQRLVELPDEIENTAVYDAFFRVSRVASCDPGELACSCLPATAALVTDLPCVQLAIDDKAVLLGFAAGLLARGAGPHAQIEERAAVRTDSPELGSEGLDPPSRWRLGHHFFALASRTSASHLRSACEAVMAEGWSRAAEALELAHNNLPAVTASMVYAAAMSALQYGDEVRPLMKPPNLDRELTGSMNLDYRSYKLALARSLAAIGSRTFDELFEIDPGFARHLDELLSLDLLDFERHIALTHRLVGTGAALHERRSESAVQTLRSLYLARLNRYLPLLAHGEALRRAFEGDQ